MIELSRGLSFVLYTYEGGPTRFTVPFPYIAREHIRAFVGEPDAARAVSVSWVDASTIEIPSQDGVLDAPYTVTIRRFTPIDALLVNYKEGATSRRATCPSRSANCCTHTRNSPSSVVATASQWRPR